MSGERTYRAVSVAISLAFILMVVVLVGATAKMVYNRCVADEAFEQGCETAGWMMLLIGTAIAAVYIELGRLYERR